MPSAVVDILQSPACILDDQGRVVSVNQAWLARLRMPAGDLGDCSIGDLVSAGDRDGVVVHFKAATLNGSGSVFECQLADEEDDLCWFSVSLQPFVDDVYRERRWLALGTNINYHKLRTLELERQLAVRDDMLNISVDCIKLIAMDGTLLHVNRSGCCALGIAEDSGFGMPWLPLLPEDVQADGEKALEIARGGVFASFPGRS